MKSYLSVLLAGACIGLIGPMTKLIGNSIPIMTVSFMRMLIATVFLLLLLPFLDKSTFNVSRKEMKHYVLLGFLIALTFSIYVVAFSLAPVSNIVLLAFTFPFWLAIISSFFLKERVTRFMILCFVIAFAGIYVINPFQGIAYMGNVMALLHAVLYAIIYAYMRYIDKRHHIGVVFWFILFATIFLSPMPFIYGLGTISWNYIWVVVLGVVSTGLAYLFLNYGLEKLQAETTSLITMTTEPVVAILLSILVIGELLTLNVLAGGILIIAAGMLLEKKYKLTRR